MYCEVHPYTLSLEKIKEMNPMGIIFTGGPNSVYDEASPHYQKEIFDLGIPILGICYGSQLMAYTLGGQVKTAPVSEYGRTDTTVDQTSVLFRDVEKETVVWMSHTDYIAEAPAGLSLIHILRDCGRGAGCSDSSATVSASKISLFSIR